MPNIAQSFQGQSLILPGAYAYTNVTATLPVSAGNVPPLVFIGASYGLQPFVPTTFANANDLMNALRGGPASAYVQEMYNPSDQINGASLVTFINASSGSTQSTLVLKDSAAASVLTLTSQNYGLPSNLLQATVSPGTIGGVEITLYDGYAGTSIVQDNLGLPFQIAYTGSGTVSYSVTSTALTITSTNAIENVTINFGAAGYTTVSQAVAYLNGTGFYSAAIVSRGSLYLSNLDLATAVSLPAPVGGVLQYVPVTAYLGDIVGWTITNANAFVQPAVITGGIVSSATTKPAVISATHFSGGTSVSPTTAAYAAAFNVALTIPGWVVFADSNSTAVQALGTQHAETASSITYQSPRRFVTGSSIGDSIATTTSNSVNLNCKQATYCDPGIYQTSTSTGINTLQSGLYWAAGVAGAMAGNPVSTPLTNKVFSGNGVEVPLTVSEINQLQNSGVMVLYVPNLTGVPTIARDVTTWETDNNPSNVFNQQVAIDQYLSYVLQQTCQPFAGTIASTYGIGQLRNAVQTTLNAQIQAGNNYGVLNSWDPSSLTVTYSSATQIAAVSVNVTPVGEITFITITTYVQPLNITVTGASSTST
jgi:hypothetical protein